MLAAIAEISKKFAQCKPSGCMNPDAVVVGFRVLDAIWFLD